MEEYVIINIKSVSFAQDDTFCNLSLRVKRSNPEDWCTDDNTATPTFIAGIATLRSR